MPLILTTAESKKLLCSTSTPLNWRRGRPRTIGVFLTPSAERLLVSDNRARHVEPVAVGASTFIGTPLRVNSYVKVSIPRILPQEHCSASSKIVRPCVRL